MRYSSFRWLLLPTFLVGCATSNPTPSPSPAPVAEAYATLPQKKLLAAKQWGLIAADVAAQTKASLEKSDFLMGRSLYVAPFSKAPFDQAFTNYMVTSLVNAGVPVTNNPEAGVLLKYETQVIPHKISLDLANEGFTPVFTLGTAWGWVMRNAFVNNSLRLGVAGTLSAAAALDYMRASDKKLSPTDVELLITTSVIDNEQYLQRSTDAYYIEKAEAELFIPPDPAALQQQQAKPRVSREWKVTK